MSVCNLRPELARHLQQRLQAFGEGFRQNLALIGPSGCGKTFQLQQLIARRYSNLSIIYCPVYRESCRSFLRRLMAAILEAGMRNEIEIAHPERDGSAEALEYLLSRAGSFLPKTMAALEPVQEILGRGVYGEALNRTLDAIQILGSERGRATVLMLDEFLYMEELGLTHAFQELGKRVMTCQSTLFVLASSSPFRARLILRERLQLLFGHFELLSLSSVESHDAATWLSQELRGLRGVKSMSPFLIHWLGSYPWYLGVFLVRMKEIVLLARSRAITEAVFFQAAWDLLGRREGVLHQWCLGRCEQLMGHKLGSRAVDVLLALGTGARTSTDLGRCCGRGSITKVMQLLVERDLVDRKGACWFVADPILRFWLATVLSAQRTVSGTGETAVRANLERYLAGLWRRWIESNSISFQERMVRLFSAFRDDTVSLDSKTGRLPRFHTIKAHEGLGDAPAGAYLIADGDGKRWCCSLQDEVITEKSISDFEVFCRSQTPKPSRKVIATTSSMDQHARTLAKASNMWVWQADDLNMLLELYGS